MPAQMKKQKTKAKMKVRINNNYKCFMSIPNINYWYDEEPTIFIGWLFWGIDIVLNTPVNPEPQNEG